MGEVASIFRSQKNGLCSQRPDGSHLSFSPGAVFDLSGDFDPLMELCKSPDGLANALGMLEAVAEGKRNKTGFAKAVYVINVDGDPITKIGVSTNPIRRLADLQAGHYRELRLHAVVFCPKHNSVKIEQEVLGRAVEKGTRLCGEWVNGEPDEVLREALTVARDLKVDVCDGKTWLANMIARTREAHAAQKAMAELESRMRRPIRYR